MLLTHALQRTLLSNPAPSFINGNVGTNSANATTLSYSHTTTIDTSCLVVAAWAGDNVGAVTLTSVTFNSIALTAVQNGVASANGPEGMFILFNPPIGTYTILLTASTAADRGIGVSSANFRNAKSVHKSGHSAAQATEPLTLSVLNTHPLPALAVVTMMTQIGGGSAIPAVALTCPPHQMALVQTQDFVSNANHKAVALYQSGVPIVRQQTLAASLSCVGAGKSYSLAVLVNG